MRLPNPLTVTKNSSQQLAPQGVFCCPFLYHNALQQHVSNRRILFLNVATIIFAHCKRQKHGFCKKGKKRHLQFGCQCDKIRAVNKIQKQHLLHSQKRGFFYGQHFSKTTNQKGAWHVKKEIF